LILDDAEKVMDKFKVTYISRGTINASQGENMTDLIVSHTINNPYTLDQVLTQFQAMSVADIKTKSGRAFFLNYSASHLIINLSKNTLISKMIIMPFSTHPDNWFPGCGGNVRITYSIDQVSWNTLTNINTSSWEVAVPGQELTTLRYIKFETNNDEFSLSYIQIYA